MKAKKLQQTLADHADWLADNSRGKMAYLSEADLRGADLRGAEVTLVFSAKQLDDANIQYSEDGTK